NVFSTHRNISKWSLPQRDETEPNKLVSRCPDGEAERKLEVPFRGHITGGLQPGKKVILVGVVDPSPDRFYIALTCGRGSREPPPNVALELCVRFKDRQILRRACMSGSWGEVERAVPFFPFIKDQPFKVPESLQKSEDVFCSTCGGHFVTFIKYIFYIFVQSVTMLQYETDNLKRSISLAFYYVTGNNQSELGEGVS
uniref:Galectin n=1 Tax=Xiphophorus maculatus TaxID=8083 RepID=A0A3B5QRN1_XIPMA